MGAGRTRSWTVALAAGALLVIGSSAGAQPVPLDDGQLTDVAGVLDEGSETEAEDALRQLADEWGVQLFAVYVGSFDGIASQEWADRTAELNGLGRDDMLLAVAVDDRQYAYTVDADFPLSDDELADVVGEHIEPNLREEDWAGAAIDGAEALGDALGGTTGGGGAGSGGWLWVLIAGLVIAGAAGGYLWWRGSRRPTAAPEGPIDPLDEMSLDDLRTEAGSLLVEMDDALKTSEIEVALAEGEFGVGAAAPFRAALGEARTSLDRAFASYHALSESAPTDEGSTRATLVEIIRSCHHADEVLDARAAEFDALRDQRSRAPEVLATLRGRLDETRAGLPAASAVLDSLRDRYPEAALRTVTDNVRSANDRIDFAAEALASADVALAATDRNRTVLLARGAEQAIAQAATLLEAIGRTEQDMAAATAQLDSGLAELRGDIASARAARQAGAGPELSGPLAVAEEALATIEEDRSAGRLDPVASLQRLTSAAAPLDALLDRREEASAALEQLIGVTRSRIAAVQEYVTTRRGAIGPEARTRVAEAERYLQSAEQRRPGDPQAALADAQRAATLAEEAVRHAQDDVDDFRRSPDGDSGLGSILIGGILLDSILRSSRGGGYPGGFGGGAGRGPRPGGFGGTGSRRGGHGRF